MNILVCENETAICKVIKLTLESCGHHVDCAADAQTAIALFEAQQEQGQMPDLIISDMLLEGDSGFYFASYVRTKGYAGRLAVMTGKKPDFKAMAAVKAEYWPKPDAIGNLVERVEGTAAQAG